MPLRVRTVRDRDELRQAVGAIGHYFGWSPTDEDGERFEKLIPFDRLHAVVDGDVIVAGAGAYPFELTLPGRPVACAGVTVVGVLPSHRRRGLLRRMMEAQLRDVRERGEPIAALWASEETIYGRFGYGLASLVLWLDVEKRDARIRPELPREGSCRHIDHDEALRVLPRLYDRIRRRSPGYLSRSRDWWELKTLSDRPEQRRGYGPLVRVLFVRDGQPAGFVLYRVKIGGSTPADWEMRVSVKELAGVDDAATRELWRFVLSIDWADRIEADIRTNDPLLLAIDRVNKLNARLFDGLWVRPVDVGAVLAARGTISRATIEIAADPMFPDNVGTWLVEDGSARRSSRRPDVRTDVQGLGTVLLGGFSFTDLVRTGRAEEVARGGLARADAAFRTPVAPHCPENF